MKDETIKKVVNKSSSLAVKIGLVAVNALIVIGVLTISYGYFEDILEQRYDNAKKAFTSTISSLEKVAYGYLQSAQTFCNNWAEFISGSDMTLDQALGFLRSINSDEKVMAHIVYYDTLEGVSTCPRPGTADDTHISYADQRDSLRNMLIQIKGSSVAEDNNPHITRAFDNPTNGESVIGFCHNMRLVDEKGKSYNVLLMRIIPAEVIRDQWVFPTGYDRAGLAIINEYGDYIIRSQKTTLGNFYDYMVQENGMDPDACAEFKRDVAESSSGDLDYVNPEGDKVYYSFHDVIFNDGWVLMGYLSYSDMNVKPIDLTIVLMVLLGFILLIICDGGYIYLVNKRLKISMEETENANSAKTRFLSSMSHDIRTPMNAIVGMTAIAEKRLDDKEGMKECLQRISRASHHLLTLINDILDISKVESGKLSLSPVVFSLAESMDNMVNVVRPLIKEKDLDFEAHVRGVVHEYIYADELRINQIFINILSNAVKYTPVNGAVKLDLEEQPSEKGEKYVRLVYTVQDNGIGMSEEFIKNDMFNAFVRAKDTRINTVQGTGLGLAIVKQMVDLMHGSIEVESKLGEGSKFIITLDLPIADKTPDEMTLNNIRTLVVDDDEMLLESSADTLKSLGIETDTVSSGKAAVEAVSKSHADGKDYTCVILDWKMPEMDGIETARAIRKDLGDHVPIMILSSYDWSDIETEAKEAGVNGFISKPLFRSTAYTKINEMLNLNVETVNPAEDNGEDLSGLNLLIAEDNEINWETISTLLEFCGITSERAENGKICVDMITSAAPGTYDAIFMDVQMPVMNGREATKLIRASELDHVKNIPIIAMTADAFAEDIRSCLESGMNGHIPKPFDMKKVFKELRKVVR